MKKKLIAIILSAATVVAIAVTAFSGLFSANAEAVLKTWSVSSEFLSVISKANNDAVAEFGSEPTTAQIASKLAFNEFSYTPAVWGVTSFGGAKFVTSSYSYITGNPSNGQAWRAQIQIPNNQGWGADKNNCGVYVYGSTTETQRIRFTAPVNGKYNLVPLGIGGPNEINESIVCNNGSMKVNVLKSGEPLMTEMVISKGEKKNLPQVEGMMLNAGDVIEVTFAGVATNDDMNAGNYVTVNFCVEITNEYAPIVTNEEKANYNLSSYLMVANDKAELPSPKGIFSTGFASKTVVANGSELVPNSKSAIYKPAVGDAAAYTWYYGYYDGDNSYGMFCEPGNNKVTFKSKYTSSQGIIITADKKGKYTVSCDSITLGGSGSCSFVVQKNNEAPVFSCPGYAANGFEQSFDLEKGEKIYLIYTRNNSDWKTGNVSLNNLNVKVVSPPRKVTPAVYNVTEYNVSEELRNNTGSWDSAYQEPTDYTRDGFLKPVAYDIDNGTIADAWLKITADHDEFSNVNQGYLNNTMMAYLDGSMRWVYDYGAFRMGFKFTAPENAIYELYSDIFVGGGINVYIYEASGSTFTQIGDAVAVPTTKDMTVSFEAKKDKTYAIVLGKAGKGWNAKKDCKTSSMVLKKKILVSDEIIEYLPITETPDPNYVFKYKVEEMEMGLSSETASAGDEVTLTLDVNKTKFGFSGFVVSVPYDSDKLELLSVEKGNVITKFGAEPLTDKNPLILTFAQADNVTSTGSVAKLKFKVKDGAAAGDITITPVVNSMVSSYNPGEVLDTTANVTVTSGTITVH